MARIAGVEIPNEKRLVIALTYLYGIGRTSAMKIAEEAGISQEMRVKNLNAEEIAKISQVVGEKYTIEGELRGIKMLNIRDLKDIGSYRGIRHRKGLKVRGQRTQKRGKQVPTRSRPIANKKKAGK